MNPRALDDPLVGDADPGRDRSVVDDGRRKAGADRRDRRAPVYAEGLSSSGAVALLMRFNRGARFKSP